MAEEKKDYGYDLDGCDVLTTAIRELVNKFPGLAPGELIAFSTMEEAGGFAMYPVGDAAIEDEHQSITGRVRQVCLYPFEVGCQVTGMSENRRAALKEKLDDLGRWLEQMKQYPSLSGGRRFLSFRRNSNSSLYRGQDDHKSEFWVVSLTARYENIFYK